MVYSTIQDVIDQYVEPSLRDYVRDYDMEGIAKAIVQWDARGDGWALKPVFDPESDHFDLELWIELLDTYDVTDEDDES